MKVFDTPDYAYTFLHGFGIRRDDTVKNPKTNEPFRKIYVCNKEGFKRMDKNASSENEKKRRRDVRTGCQAKLRITRQEDGKWLVDSFNDTHNHDLTMTLTKVMKLRSHNSFHRSIKIESQRASEEDEDFKTMNSRPVLSSVHLIEAKAGQWYTRKMFDNFKKEWTEAITNLTHETIGKTTEESTYRVGQLDVDKKYWRIVTFRSLDQVSVTCSCAKYETNGILCKHSLYVMKKKHVKELPSHYILSRWTLNVRYKLGSASIGLGEMNNEYGVSAYTLWCVRSNFTKLIEQARDSP
uniref:SWIM-type domain-containing protein n=1 Tax=Lactuca sativa TaxID=4236 RepID=A0A9R1X134_LACSA|nr:hypothetical protein LSAT_V11C800399740 [Lactuca sativa]